MIIRIDESNFDKIHEILIEYGRDIRKDDNPDITISKYNELVKDLQYELYYYSDDETNQGMSLVNLKEEKMENFYMKTPKDSIKSEIDFFDWIFNYLMGKTGGFISQYPLFSPGIVNRMTNLGIESITRHVMLINNSVINGILEPSLKNQYKFAPWSDKYIDTTAKLTVDAYEGTLDSRIFVFFQHIEESKEFVKDASSNKFGAFDKNIESVLLEGEDVIGVCFINIKENKGFIPSLVISPNKRGLGLGKSLLIHTMKDLHHTHPIESVGLLVTEQNQTAYQLYKKLGFKTIDSGFTYLK